MSEDDAGVAAGIRADRFAARWVPSQHWELISSSPTSPPSLRFSPGGAGFLWLTRKVRHGGNDPETLAADLVIELDRAPFDLEPGSRLRLEKGLYQAGHAILLYRSENGAGTLTVLADDGEVVELDADLSFDTPERCEAHPERVAVTGRIALPRTKGEEG